MRSVSCRLTVQRTVPPGGASRLVSSTALTLLSWSPSLGSILPSRRSGFSLALAIQMTGSLKRLDPGYTGGIAS